MTPLGSESSIPLPGEQPRAFRSSPPPFDSQAFEEMDNQIVEASKSEPANTKSNGEPQAPAIRADSGETERPPSAQRVNVGTTEPIDLGETDDDENDDEEEFPDPTDEIDRFDWNDLNERYHNAMNHATNEEAELMQEWRRLMDYFRVWADAGPSHETDRTFSRLRTRTAYVQHSEEKLKQTRDHYVSVVKAFEGALALLQDRSFPG